MLILKSRQERWRSEADCAASAQRLAAQPGLRDAIIELHGGLGAGKTTFARHLLRALGITGTVKSPTYAVMEVYAGAISHFDFYRFNEPQEWEDAGLRDVFAQAGLKLVEWPDKARALLPTPDLQLVIEPHGAAQREACWNACTIHGLKLLPPAP